MTAALAAALVAAGIGGGGLGFLLTWPGLRRSRLARAARWPLASVPWARSLRLRWWRIRRVPVREDGRLSQREFAAMAGLAEAMRDVRGTARVAAEEWAAEAMMREAAE